MEQPTIALNLAQYTELKASGGMRLMRLQADHYQLVVRKFDPTNGKPASPDCVQINREGAKAMAEGLKNSIAELDAQKASLQKAIDNLTVAMVADMDALDAAAKADGDL